MEGNGEDGDGFYGLGRLDIRSKDMEEARGRWAMAARWP
jgi:hypothetical protein